MYQANYTFTYFNQKTTKEGKEDSSIKMKTDSISVIYNEQKIKVTNLEEKVERLKSQEETNKQFAIDNFSNSFIKDEITKTTLLIEKESEKLERMKTEKTKIESQKEKISNIGRKKTMMEKQRDINKKMRTNSSFNIGIEKDLTSLDDELKTEKTSLSKIINYVESQIGSILNDTEEKNETKKNETKKNETKKNETKENEAKKKNETKEENSNESDNSTSGDKKEQEETSEKKEKDENGKETSSKTKKTLEEIQKELFDYIATIRDGLKIQIKKDIEEILERKKKKKEEKNENSKGKKKEKTSEETSENGESETSEKENPSTENDNINSDDQSSEEKNNTENNSESGMDKESKKNSQNQSSETGEETDETGEENDDDDEFEDENENQDGSSDSTTEEEKEEMNEKKNEKKNTEEDNEDNEDNEESTEENSINKSEFCRRNNTENKKISNSINSELDSIEDEEKRLAEEKRIKLRDQRILAMDIKGMTKKIQSIDVENQLSEKERTTMKITLEKLRNKEINGKSRLAKTLWAYNQKKIKQYENKIENLKDLEETNSLFKNKGNDALLESKSDAESISLDIENIEEQELEVQEWKEERTLALEEIGGKRKKRWFGIF